MSVLPVGQRAAGEEKRHHWRVLYSPEELNRAYARVDAAYNCLASNWEWFKDCRYEIDPWQQVQLRVEQN
ncbi:MAG TPA: hypothetical protein GXX34_07415 [Clostridia bacterium]|nr:hypothetical protein [Clostridia bacterium]